MCCVLFYTIWSWKPDQGNMEIKKWQTLKKQQTHTGKLELNGLPLIWWKEPTRQPGNSAFIITAWKGRLHLSWQWNRQGREALPVPMVLIQWCPWDNHVYVNNIHSLKTSYTTQGLNLVKAIKILRTFSLQELTHSILMNKYKELSLQYRIPI